MKILLKANQEMIDGYMDGFDLNSPEPSSNRTDSYRHGFMNGRADKTGITRGMSYEWLVNEAERCITLDGY